MNVSFLQFKERECQKGEIVVEEQYSMESRVPTVQVRSA